MIDPLTPRPIRAGPLDDGSAPTTFGKLLRGLRLRMALSQNQLAREAGVDPAYVNRLERAPDDSTAMPRRRVVLQLWEVLSTDPNDRDRLLVASGHCPQSILDAGGWDRYTAAIREAARLPLLDVLDRLRDAVHTTGRAR